jgi:hypothetical protein
MTTTSARELATDMMLEFDRDQQRREILSRVETERREAERLIRLADHLHRINHKAAVNGR